MTALATDAQGATPLSAQQEQELLAARHCSRKVERAANVAKFDAWCTAVFAGATLAYCVIGAAFGSFHLVSWIVGLGMAVIARTAFRGERELRQFDERGPRRLGLNQLAFAALIVVYCAWQIYKALTGQGEYAEVIRQAPELGEMLGDMDDLMRWVTVAVYGGVIVGSLIVQGLTALYYFTRAGLIRKFLLQTPPWAIDILRIATATSLRTAA